MAFSNFPYTDFHNLNLDWVLETITNLIADWKSYNESWDNWKTEIETQFDNLVDFVYTHLSSLVDESVKKELEAMLESGELARIVEDVISKYTDEIKDNRVSNRWLIENQPRFDDFLGIRGTIYSNDETNKIVRDKDVIKECGFHRIRLDAWWDELADFSGSNGYPILGYNGTITAIERVYNAGFKLDINITANQRMTSGTSKFPTTDEEIRDFIAIVRRFVTDLKNRQIIEGVRLELWNEPETFGVTALEYYNVAVRFYETVKSIADYPVIVGNNSFIPNVLIEDYAKLGLFEYGDYYCCHPYTGNNFSENPLNISERYLELFSCLAFKNGIKVHAGEYGFLTSTYTSGYSTAQTLDLMKFGFSSADYFALYGRYGILGDDGSLTPIANDFKALNSALHGWIYVQPLKTTSDGSILQFIDANENFKYIAYAKTGGKISFNDSSYDVDIVPNVLDIAYSKNCYSNSYADAYNTLFKMQNVMMSKGQISGLVHATQHLRDITGNGIYIYFAGGNDVPVKWLQNDYGMMISMASAEYVTHIAYSGLSNDVYVDFSSDRGNTWRGWKSLNADKSGHFTQPNFDTLTDEGEYSFSGGFTYAGTSNTNAYGIIFVTNRGDDLYVLQEYYNNVDGSRWWRIGVKSGSTVDWRDWSNK